MGLTEYGYRRRTYEEILNAKIAKAKELFGDDINTDDNTALGKYIRINAYDQATVEELAEKIYYSIFPQTSVGKSLDRLGWSVGMERNVATPSRYKVKVTGTAGETVEFGFLVGTESEVNFYNTKNTVIGEDGTCEITVECVEAGTIGNVAASDINKIVNPVAELDSAVGVSLVELGEDEESDYDFIKRYEVVREGKGSCNAASIISAISNVPTVNGVYVTANDDATQTVNDIPPKTIAIYVDGGENYSQEIADAIFDKKPVGIGTYGTESVSVSYGALTDYDVRFSFAKTVGVYVKVTLETNVEFGTNGNSEIKMNIESFVSSLGISKPLIVTTLYSQIYSVSGVVSAIVEVSTDGKTYGANNIPVEPYERCTVEQVIINGTAV